MRPVQRIAEEKRHQHPWQVRLRKFFGQAWVEITIGGLVIVSVILTLFEFALETKLHLRDNSPGIWESSYGVFDQGHLNALMTFNLLITSIFIVELFLRYLAAASKVQYLKEFWLDILATIPVFRIFRSSRALRLLRLVRLIRLTGVISRLSSHYPQIFRSGAIDFLMISGLLVVAVVFGTVGMLQFEDGDVGNVSFAEAAEIDGSDARDVSEAEGLANSFWFSIYTLFAGEPIPRTPTTLLGKFVTVMLMFMGMTIFAIFTGTVSAFMVDRIRTEGRVVEWGDLEDHIVICGWTPKTEIIIKEYRAAKGTRKTPIVVITQLDVTDIGVDVTVYPNLMLVNDDFTRISALKRAGIERAKTCIVLSDTTCGRSEQDADARTILAALTVEKIHPGVYTCAELLNSNYATHLELGQVNDFVVSEEYGAYMLAQSGMNRGLAGIMGELLTYQHGNEFYRVAVPESWIGSSFDEKLVTLKTQKNAILVGVLPADGPQLINPLAYEFKPGDEIIAISKGELVL